MLLRKLRPPAIALPWADQAKSSSNRLPSRFKQAFLLSSFFSIGFLLLYFRFNFNPSPTPPHALTILPRAENDTSNNVDDNPAPMPTSTCRSRASVFVYDLPAKFNSDFLARCESLNMYTNMCPYVSNRGLGRPLPSLGHNWFATHQFTAEMIFHARMENHPCRTTDPDRANLFYVPFYGGLHVSSMFREKDHTTRDALVVELAEHVRALPTWHKHGGADYFITLGRTAWDFLRNSNRDPDFGGNILLDLPPVRNMSVFTVERQPWIGSNQHGIPYPSYFHPATSSEMLTWQNHVRESKRPHLFSFIGGPRKFPAVATIRDELIRQCNVSAQCHLLLCEATKNTCSNPSRVLGVMLASRFCLQAPGDSFTRRSTFDAVLTGCIPVFFTQHTAYTQYRLYFPADPKEYSVFVQGESKDAVKRADIEKVLAEIPAERVEMMRRRVIDLIPGITYAHPNATELGFRDAVDVAIEGLLEVVESKLRQTSRG